MKYTVTGFKQQGMIELGLSADDLNILRWFIDFKDSGGMVKEYCVEEDCFYYWIKYDALIEALPYLFTDNKTEDAKKKKVQRLFNGNLSKVLKKKLIKRTSGTYTFFALIEGTYKGLLDSTGQNKASNINLEGCTGQDLSGGHRTESVQPKDSSINNSSINNIEKTANNKKTTYMDLTFIEDYIDTVKITQDQYDKLVKDYGVNIVNNTIRNLDNYIVNKKPKYKDHNRVLRTWLSKNQNGKEHEKRKDIPSLNAEQKPKRKYGF